MCSFDEVNHDWMVKFLRHRIGDERVIRLIIRMLKSGIMEDGLTHATEEGTPQGSILSPLLSNIYLHCATDILFKWLNRKSQRKAYTWDQFKQALAWANWPTVKIHKDLNPCRRAEAY